MSSAYLLVSHGSRDPRPQVAMNQLATLISQRQSKGINLHGSLRDELVHAQLPPLPASSKAGVEATACMQTAGDNSSSTTAQLAAMSTGEPLIGTACLELSPVPLHEQIKEFGAGAIASGYNRLQVVPLFLLPGVHVMEDIPTEVAIAQQALAQELKIALRPHLGTHPGLSGLLATQMAATKKADASILLAHGSRRPGYEHPVEAMAKQLGSGAADICAVGRTGVVVSAYWAVPPKLELRVKELVNAGHRQIGILPYFLFAGGITDAIAQSVEELKLQFPNALLHLAEPLGASAELADLICDLIEQ